MDDIVTVKVLLKGNNLANAVYDLTYDPTRFELTSATTSTAATNGTISERFYKSNGQEVFANGDTLATYTFKALAQTEDVTADFTLSNTKAATYTESIEAQHIIAGNNTKATVDIKLKEYTPTITVDASPVTEASKLIKYNGANHTFEVTTAVQGATITYKVDGVDTDSVSVKDRKTYNITYTIDAIPGYRELSGSFTITIADPEYKVEVNLTSSNNADYVSGKKLVLVYTNVDGVSFKFDSDLMIDVSSRGYKYNDTTEYEHVYGFVTDVITGGTLDNYAQKVTCDAPVDGGLMAITYSTDLNFDNVTDILDISTGYGIYNVRDDYYSKVKYQRNILRADINGDKLVDGNDTGLVVNAAK